MQSRGTKILAGGSGPLWPPEQGGPTPCGPPTLPEQGAKILAGGPGPPGPPARYGPAALKRDRSVTSL